MSILIWLMNFVSLIQSCNCAQIYCKSPYECSNKTINGTENDEILLFGFKSNYGMGSSVNGGEVSVYGSNTAQYASSINAHLYLHCYGYKSCANVASLRSNDENLECLALGSCMTANIIFSDFVPCFAEMSCAFAIINTTNSIRANGAFSLYSSIIDVTESPAATIFFSGYYSGYNTTIYNRNSNVNDATDIYCRGNGCYGTKLVCNCQNEMDCNNFNVYNCDSNYVACPNFVCDPYLNSSFVSIVTNILDIGDELNNNCDDSANFFSYDNWHQTDGEIIGITSENSNDNDVCCRGYVSCYQASMIVNRGYNNIVCNARSACRYASMIQITTTGTLNGNIFCIGTYSCENSTIH